MGLIWNRIPYSWKRRAIQPITDWDYTRAALYLILPVVILIALVLLFSCNARADTLPDAPRPQSRRIWYTETITLGALYASDWTLTSKGLGEPIPGGRVMLEQNPVLGPRPSNTRIALYGGALFATEALVLSRTERSRHRWVRWAGRVGWGYFVVDEIRCIRSWKR